VGQFPELFLFPGRILPISVLPIAEHCLNVSRHKLVSIDPACVHLQRFVQVVEQVLLHQPNWRCDRVVSKAVRLLLFLNSLQHCNGIPQRGVGICTLQVRFFLLLRFANTLRENITKLLLLLFGETLEDGFSVGHEIFHVTANLFSFILDGQNQWLGEAAMNAFDINCPAEGVFRAILGAQKCRSAPAGFIFNEKVASNWIEHLFVALFRAVDKFTDLLLNGFAFVFLSYLRVHV
jgi:hypothetical protein